MNNFDFLDFLREYEYTEEIVCRPTPTYYGHNKFEKNEFVTDPEIEKLIEEVNYVA